MAKDKDSDGGEGEDGEGDPTLHEGTKLRELLKNTRHSFTELGVAAGVTRAAVSRWLTTEEYGPTTWKKIATALKKIGLPPGEVRPPPQTPGTARAREDLTIIVQSWPDEQLRQLHRILNADVGSRDNLIAYINGAMRPGKTPSRLP